MNEHPMITAMREARLIAANKGDDAIIAVCNAAMKWLEDLDNLSDAAQEAGNSAAKIYNVFTSDAIFTAMIKQLRKEIEGHE